jgi:glycine/D-amino acid oxidase-like deaminating enzyme
VQSVIVASDTYTRGLWPEIQRELTHLPYFNIATQPLSEHLRKAILPERQGIVDTRTVLSSVRLDRSNRLIIGSIGALRGTGTHVHMAWAKRTIRKLFPQIGDIGLDYIWSGSIGMTDTHLPKFHRLAPDVLSISGYNGRGIAAGTVFGRLLAQLTLGEITERDMPLPLTDPRTAKFRSWQSLYYEVGAQAAHFMGARV